MRCSRTPALVYKSGQSPSSLEVLLVSQFAEVSRSRDYRSLRRPVRETVEVLSPREVLVFGRSGRRARRSSRCPNPPADAFLTGHEKFPDDPKFGIESPRAIAAARVSLENGMRHHPTCNKGRDGTPCYLRGSSASGTTEPPLHESNSKHAPYLTLVYRWGLSDNLKTTTDTLPARTAEIALTRCLPDDAASCRAGYKTAEIPLPLDRRHLSRTGRENPGAGVGTATSHIHEHHPNPVSSDGGRCRRRTYSGRPKAVS